MDSDDVKTGKVRPSPNYLAVTSPIVVGVRYIDQSVAYISMDLLAKVF